MKSTVHPPAQPDDLAGPPAGFKAITIGGPFIAHNGPLYARRQADKVQLGFRVLEQHCNPLGMCHGGMLASFADMLLPVIAFYQSDMPRHFLPTISLQIDYLGGAARGSWVQGEGELLRRTRNLVFVQGLVSADGAAALRVSGIFKIGQLIGDGKHPDPFGLGPAL